MLLPSPLQLLAIISDILSLEYNDSMSAFDYVNEQQQLWKIARVLLLHCSHAYKGEGMQKCNHGSSSKSPSLKNNCMSCSIALLDHAVAFAAAIKKAFENEVFYTV